MMMMMVMMMVVVSMVCVRCETRQQITDERLRDADRMSQLMKKKPPPEPQSPYRREVAEEDWKRFLRKMVVVEDIRYPCSDWWNEYLHCVVS